MSCKLEIKPIPSPEGSNDSLLVLQYTKHISNAGSTQISMQPVSTTDAKFRMIRQKKRIYGAIYGIVAGLAFAISTWGWDGFLLSQAHAFLPWTKLIIGSVGCAVAGGLAGWLS